MRYFIKIPAIAAAESDAAAERLIARGYQECPRAYFMTWWRLRDAACGSEMERAAWRAQPLMLREVGWRRWR